MLKKISVGQFRVGMFVQRLEGSWFDHPFWKTRFLLTDPRDLGALRRSKIREVWIDTSKGLDVPPPAPAPAPPIEPAPEPLDDRPSVPPAPAEPPITAEQEIGKAAEVFKRSSGQVFRLVRTMRGDRRVDMETASTVADEIADSVQRHPGAMVSLARLKDQNQYFYLHSLAVAAQMAALARYLGMDPQACKVAGLAGLLHNAGMARLPSSLLNKVGKLDDDELAQVRSHPVEGHTILSAVPDLPIEVLDTALYHHERWDGGGYPFGLEGQAIPLFARMCAIADSYDALISNRTYRSGLEPAESVARMTSREGAFDPELLKAFVRCQGAYPTGSLVRLQSRRLGIVVDQHPDPMLPPRVKVFYSLASQMPIPPETIDLSASSNRDRILAREPVAQWTGLDLDTLWAGEALERLR